MSAFAVLAATGAAAVSIAVQPSGDVVPGHAVVEPTLLIAPSDAELSLVYPVQAFRHGQGGRSTMECRVRRNRSLADCRLVAETPDGAGFGQAILESAHDWRLRPRRVDGRAVDDGQVRLTVVWVTLP